jgi:hypothetical protein
LATLFLFSDDLVGRSDGERGVVDIRSRAPVLGGQIWCILRRLFLADELQRAETMVSAIIAGISAK